MLQIIISFQLFYYQVYKLNIKNSKLCLNIFKSNNVLGFLVFLNLIAGKL